MSDYCSFSKAVEQLGDRWSLVIIREMVVHGDRGFTDLLAGVPGIGRSMLSARLRKLRDLGLVELAARAAGAPRYRLTPAGHDLEPVLANLRAWAERFLPEDPAMIERDADIVVSWLARRVVTAELPQRPVVIEIALEGGRRRDFWLVLERGVESSVCIEDPALAPDRYVFVEGDVQTIALLSRGLRDWRTAIADGSVRLAGDPDIVRMLPNWFIPAGATPTQASVERKTA
jgi:DNA-binding HxlR family transcriptional regulator